MVATKNATTVAQQISLLQKRGMQISDVEKAEECLLDIGYYRLGFYWFPFEQTFPCLTYRNHQFKESSNFDDVIKLYYFDFDLRNILLKYISRIEINFRTKLVYYVSNTYQNNPTWYIDNTVVNDLFLKSPAYKKTIADINTEDVIKRDLEFHHTQNAPAWKVIEFMSFGTIIELYKNLNNPTIKCKISNLFGITNPSSLYKYINTIRRLRNSCAHGKVIFDTHLPQAIPNGVCGQMDTVKTKFAGAYYVFKYFLNCISTNRASDMQQEMKSAFEQLPDSLRSNIITPLSGLTIEKI